MKIDMVLIKNNEVMNDEVVKKQFEVINQDNVISFNLKNFTLAVRKEDLLKIL